MAFLPGALENTMTHRDIPITRYIPPPTEDDAIEFGAWLGGIVFAAAELITAVLIVMG